MSDYGSQLTETKLSAISQNDTSTEKQSGQHSIKNQPRAKLTIWKDVIVLSIGFSCNYIAFTSFQNIQSSLNSEHGLGTIALGTMYSFAIVSSFIMPSLMINLLGLKRTIVCGLPFITLYIISNSYATWFTLVPSLALFGIVAGPLWSGQYSLLTILSFEYAQAWNISPEIINGRFFGIFFMIFHGGEVLGNLISSLILNSGVAHDNHNHSYGNCGMHYCAQSSDTLYSLNKSDEVLSGQPSAGKIYTLCGIFSALSLAGTILIAVFVQSDISNLNGKKSKKVHGCDYLKVIFKQMKNPIQLLMAPLSIFSGLSLSYMASDFTKAFIECSLGIEYIGFVVMTGNIMDATFSICFTTIMKMLHRSVVYIFGAIINISLYLVMIHWIPNSSTPWIFYIISGFWGVSNAVWQTHFCGFYGILFEDNIEAAYSAFQLLQFIGLFTGFMWSSFVCINIKIYTLLAVVILGIIAYGIIEYHLYKIRANNNKCEIVSVIRY